MENQSGTHSSNVEDTVKQQENEPENKTTVTQDDDAGPSQTYNLPGSVPFRANPSLKVSKSEISIRQTHTSPDVAALNLTSISFGPQGHELNSGNTKPSNVEGTNEDNTTFAEMKKILASYFRINKDNQIAVAEVQNTPLVATVQDDTSCVVGAQTEDKSFVAANQVIVTNQPTPERELSKCVSENKKKTPDSLSDKSGFGVVQRDSLSSIGSNVCRICMTRGRERLISPCNCKGSLANVHLTCLERWLNQVGRNHCELCGFSYPAIRTPRYTVLQALRLWFGNPRNRSHLQSDCLIFWLLSTVTAGLLAVCIVGTQYFVMEGNKFGKTHGLARKEEGISHRITETAMDFFMAIVLCGYSVTVYLLCKDHYVLWSRWRRANVHVRLLLSADADPVPFAPRRYNNIV